MPPDKQQAAVALAAEGFRVFPVRVNDKRPAVAGWQGFASADPEKAERRWRGIYANHNIGIATGAGLLVLDFDTRDGKPGLRSLESLEMMGLPESRRVRTPSGGVHVYLAVSANAGITIATEFWPGVDVRCDGGYVLGPGSVIDGVAYEWADG